ncbi:MAG: hypothetical protein ACOY3Y_02750, partial [Acidobacteriota bacterium]
MLAILYATTGMSQAPDTWAALAAGRHIAGNGVSQVEPFSFEVRTEGDPARQVAPPSPSGSRAPHGWVNQKWLAHLLLFRLFDLSGGNALVAGKFAVYALLGCVLALASVF